MASLLQNVSENELSDEELPNFSLNFDFENINDENIPPVKETAKLNEVEIRAFLEENENKNTAKKTRTDLNIWKRWCASVGESRPIEDIPPEELDSLLSHFFIKIRKLDGEEFEPGSLTSFQRSFDRYLRSLSKPYSLLKDIQFSKSRATLETKRKQLRLEGKGRRPNKALGLDKDEMEKLWSQKQLGNHSPEALIRTIWFNNTIHFGWRARDEHRKVLFGDLQIRQEQDEEKREYVIWLTERGSKTRSGGKEFGAERYFDPRMYATGTGRCPVKYFKEYLARRPLEMTNPQDPFYLAVNKNPGTGIWFKKQPLGIHSLGNFMKQMATNIDLPGKRTNHSARRTMISTLRHQNFHPLDISQLTGHKNLKSIDEYSTVSDEQQKNMSLVLSNQSGGGAPLKPVNETSVSLVSSRTTASTNTLASATTSFPGAVFNQCTFNFGDVDCAVPSKRSRSDEN